MSAAQLTAVAWGRPDNEVIATLYAAEHSRHQMLAAQALREHASVAASALRVLHETGHHDPTAVAVTLRQGWWGTWVTGLHRGTADRTPAAVIARLSALAAVAAARTGAPADLTVPMSGGRLHLPGWGTLAADAGELRLTVRDGTVIAHQPAGTYALPVGETVDGWIPARRLAAGGLRLLVDDRDPGRDCFRMPLRGPLPDGEFAALRRTIGQGWRLLARSAPELARQVAAGLWAVVPLAPPPDGSETSVTCSDAIGAIGATGPGDAVDAAVMLVHEWSHSLLNGMLGFVELHDPRDAGTFWAPWRPDPRPLSGLLHGTFAFLAVAETWRVLRAAGVQPERAEAEFAVRRRQLAEVLAVLPGVPALSPQGRRFVAVLQRRCRALFATPVSRHADEQASAAVRRQAAAHEQAAGAPRHGDPRP
ncbi:HEXXH motif domain-containing protein [Mangrovihabitans endophyticus]|uniref:HEXXH motif domain-containing protein n=1 Tax=Mangrovihabitans endophyticus TaxID=1751298 RepID=A0A8J3C6H2_9ACTN|nr:HEXXH motif domain-containing protein [Mangrovihabitans endophyticus]